MTTVKLEKRKKYENTALILVYVVLIINAVLFKDSLIAVLSAFFGITYTMLAGKGNPKCYLFGLAGSGLYSWLSLTNALWGNLCLYAFYYIPMQILGYFKWKKHLKENQQEIIKSKLSKKELTLLTFLSVVLTLVCIYVLFVTSDKNPIIDGITTVFSIVGMYLTVKRAFEQWIVWIIVNGLTAIMWINIVLSGEKVYSTVLMWIVYFILAVYFYRVWKREVV